VDIFFDKRISDRRDSHVINSGGQLGPESGLPEPRRKQHTVGMFTDALKDGLGSGEKLKLTDG